MAAPKRIDDKTLCDMAIDKVTKTISIKFHQYPSFGEKFKAKCIEEAFEEMDVLTDDFAEGFAESVILGYIFEEIQIRDNDKEPLCTAIHYILRTFSPPPTSLNLVDIKAKVDKKQIAWMSAQLEQQAILLKPGDTKDEALTKLIIVGENNHFPLLTYLVDTFVRFILLDYQRLYKLLNSKKKQRKREKFISKRFNSAGKLQTFFKNCYAMKEIAKKAKTQSIYEDALLWYESGIKSFNHRLMAPLKMHPNKFVYKINDSMLVYAKYYIAILNAVHNILQNPMIKLPLQIDFWVIPKAMTQCDIIKDNDDDGMLSNDENENKSNNDDIEDEEDDDDIDDDDDDDDDDQSKNQLNNFDQRLKYTDNLVIKEVKDKEISKLSRCLYGIYENVVKEERAKRMVIIVDRRIVGKDGKLKDEIENKENYGILSEDEQKKQQETDKIYGFLPKKSQNIPSGHYLHESMFNLSRLEVLPSENGKVQPETADNNAIHAVSTLLNGNMCLLSIHIHQENVVRAYWSINGTSARFFVNDMVNIWPLFFREKEIEQTYETSIPQDVGPIINLIRDNTERNPLNDVNFDAFFEANTQSKSAKGEIEEIKEIEEETEEIQKN